MRRVLITGAAGRTGVAVTAACVARELVVRAFVPGAGAAAASFAARFACSAAASTAAAFWAFSFCQSS